MTTSRPVMRTPASTTVCHPRECRRVHRAKQYEAYARKGKDSGSKKGTLEMKNSPPRRGPRVVIEAEGNPHPRGPILCGERDEEAPSEPSQHAQPPEIASGQEQKDGEEGEDVGSLHDAGRQEAQ